MVHDKSRLGIGVIGCGHWGPNHIRVFSEHERSVVRGCADLSAARLENIRRRFPEVRTTTQYAELLADETIEAVVIATPTATHARIAQEALWAGKHVLVEKPLCRTSEEGVALIETAERARRVLMVGHIFLFNGGIIKLKELLCGGELGRVQYLDAVRTNLGPVRGDVNALFDLGTHDISIFNYLLGQAPISVSATGSRLSQAAIEDVCFATLQYADGTLAHLHASWLNPRKVRTITIVGSSKMAHWDDIDPQDTLRIFDKGLAEPPNYNSFGEFQYLIRSADVHVPAVPRAEPLVRQAETFVRWVKDAGPAGPTARDGLDVVRTLEAAMTSLRRDGAMVEVAAPIVHDERILATASGSAIAVGIPRGSESETAYASIDTH